MALFVCLGLIAAIKVLKNGTQKCDKNERKSVTHIAKKFGGGYNEKNFKDRNGLCSLEGSTVCFCL